MMSNREGFSTYQEYREPPEEWMTKVPSKWTTKRARFCFKEINNRSETGEEELLSLSKDQGLVPRSELTDETHRADSLEGYKICKEGDIVMNKMQAWNGMFGIANQTGLVSPDYTVFRPQNEVDPKYFLYLLKTPLYIGQFRWRSRGIGTAYLRLHTQHFYDVPLFYPSPEVQSKIATFLDHHTEQIDELITKKNRLRELVEEKQYAVITRAVTEGLDSDSCKKESSLDWVEKIPSDWDIVPLKFLAEIRTGIAKGRKKDDQELVSVPYLRVANVQDGYLDLGEVHEIEVTPQELSRYKLRPGDVLMNEGGDIDKLGRGTVWQGEIDPCIHQNHVFCVRPYEKSNSEWISKLTESKYLKHYFMAKAKRTTNLASISSANIASAPIILPPADKREMILNHISEIEDEVESLRSEIDVGTDLLQEKREALITAATTGQIDVSNWELPLIQETLV